ncbi:MAG: hypothetical protein CMF48_01140 [Legionellales bacterium]|nr:hypothetical protein [Legionellales bacterium]
MVIYVNIFGCRVLSVHKLLGVLVFIISRCLKFTLRHEVVGKENFVPHKQHILCFWHGKQFVPSLFYPPENKPVTALVSASKDGQIMSTFLHCLGFQTVRGSSSRKAVSSLVMMLKAARGGSSVAVTPDGPRGPIYTAKPGVAFLATKTGLEVVPFGSAVSRKWVIQSWDRYEIPKPFSKCVFYIGKPFKLSPKMSPEEASRLISSAIWEADLAALGRLHGISDLKLDAQCQSDKTTLAS